MNTETIDDLKRDILIIFEPRYGEEAVMKNFSSFSSFSTTVANKSLVLGYIGGLRFRVIKDRYYSDVYTSPTMKVLLGLYPSIIRLGCDIVVNEHDLALMRLFW